jgi:LacI family transcriptional regulator
MITIRDVAREAGVSIATVSRVFNNAEAVAADTRREVRAVATRLGYSPHGAARSLITRRTATIGLILPDLYGEFFSELIRGVDQAVRAHGYHLLVSSSHADRAEVDSAMALMRGRVDGVVVMLPDRDGEHVPPTSGRLPFVRLGGAPHNGDGDAIVVANRDGARAMVHHLVELGHTRIGVIAGAEGNSDAEERMAGVVDGLVEAGLDQGAMVRASGDFSEASGFRAARELIRANPRPTAIFALNDAMAIGALSALRAAGLKVPSDIAVAGFDDIPMAQFLDPPLTTVRVDISAMGARAANRVLSRLGNGPSGSGVEIVPTTLMVRRSCGNPEAWRPNIPESLS